jgi:hypothetical protein
MEPDPIYSDHPGDTPEILALRALVRRDEEHDCYFCSKDSWNIEDHTSKCPFGIAYAVLKRHAEETREEQG